MPNLVGIGNSQVPTNAMLGGLAYQDPSNANLTNVEIENIAAIKAKLGETATDIFVYDTRKDSDGGAWRKRTQHTSWYNEGVSATRGARKEFPAVAVIVGGGSVTTIYDADDPNLSLWMEFKNVSGGDKIFNRPEYWNTSSVFALNGIVCFANSVGAAESTLVLNYVNDSVRLYPISGYPTYGGDYSLGISGRSNSSGAFSSISQNIYGDEAFGVAMTVLPNAPIDPATGLPIPTIAVAHGHGITFIKDNGTDVDMRPVGSSVPQSKEIYFTKSHKLAFTHGGNWVYYYPIPLDNMTATYWNGFPHFHGRFTDTQRDWAINGIPINVGANGITNFLEDRAIGHTNGVDIIDTGDLWWKEGGPKLGSGMHCGIATNFNTGWQHGDIQGAFLSDTDDTNITADSLQDNSNTTLDSTFATTTGWTANADWTISGGVATCNGQNNGRWIYPSNSSMFTQGTSVAVEVTVTAYTSGTLYISYGTGGLTAGTSMTGTGTFYHVGECTGNGIVYIRSDSFIGSVDNVKMYIAEADHSVKNKGLAVVGTINKTAVATGAELVAYSGFSPSNYMKFDSFSFGTGDFSVSVWAIPSTDTTNEFILEMDDASQSSNRFYLLVTNTSTKRLYVPWDTDVAGSELTPGMWNHIVVGRRSGVAYVYVNGISPTKGMAWTTSLNGNGYGAIGNYSATPNTQYAWSGSLALLRISKTMPSTEQVKKMYNDEKQLFQENAKCTLYGSSDAVTALAYDDSNDIVHAGTSSGRSEFSGLNRINNTTTAITTAVSVSNGLVAEQ